MSLESDVRRLSAVRPFDALPREALQMLAFSCPKRVLKAGEALFAAGDAAVEAFVILDGEILLRRNATERRAGAGALIGETALLIATVRPADATASKDSTLMRISVETFHRVLSEFPQSAAGIRHATTRRTRALVDAMDRVRRRAYVAAP